MFSVHSNKSLYEKEAMNEAEHYHKKLLKIKIATNSFIEIRSVFHYSSHNGSHNFNVLIIMCNL